MNQKVKEMIYEVAKKHGSNVKKIQPKEGTYEMFVITLNLPNERKQDVFIVERGNDYIRFESPLVFFENSWDLKNKLDLESILRTNYYSEEGSFGITEFTAEEGKKMVGL